jgi:hypothetical protein
MVDISYFLNLFLPHIPRPKNPDPKRSMVAGSGTELLPDGEEPPDGYMSSTDTISSPHILIPRSSLS